MFPTPVRSTGKNQLDCDLVIVDEASMVDLQLLDRLLQALPSSAAVLLVGDPDQLPSIGAGDVLRHLITSIEAEDGGLGAVTKLTEKHRQTGPGQLVSIADEINAGVVPAVVSSSTSNCIDLPLSRSERLGSRNQNEFYFIEAETPAQVSIFIMAINNFVLSGSHVWNLSVSHTMVML